MSKNPKVDAERAKNQARRSAANTKVQSKPSKVQPVPVKLPGRPPCVDGIDFSSWSGKVDWIALRDNPKLSFVYFRASLGYTRDPRYLENLQGALAVFNKPFGVYHYFLPQRDVKRQADLAASLAEETTLPLWFDVEACQGMDKNFMGNACEKFVKYLEDHYSLVCDIYTSPGFWDYNLPRTNWAKYHGLAVASWSRVAVLPTIPQDWILRNQPVATQRRDRWAWWQHWNQGRINGINASVDLIRCPKDKFVKLLG